MSDASVVTRARALQQRIQALKRSRETATNANTVRTRAEQMDRAAAPLRELTPIAELLRTKQIRTALPVEAVKKAQADHSKRYKKYEAEPDSFFERATDSSFNYEYLMRIDALKPRIQDALEEAWQGYVDRRTTHVESELLDTLAAVPGFSSTVSTIRQTSVVLSQQRQSLPRSLEAIEQVDHLSSQLAEHWQSLEAEGIDATVIQFLKAAASPSGAPLTGIADSVSAWLQKHDLMPYLRVRLSGGGDAQR